MAEQIKPIAEIDKNEAKPPSGAPAPATKTPGATPSMVGAQPTSPAGAAAVISRPQASGRIWKIILIILGVIIVGAAVFFFFFYRATITVKTEPTPDSILLDGKEIKPGAHKILPGSHTILIKKNGYVSYETKRDFKINEKLNLTMTLQKEVEATLISAGASDAQASYDGRLINFVSSSGQISTVAAQPQDNKYLPTNLSNASYKNIRSVNYSDNNSFALILDADALRLVDFSATDIINQAEVILPPAAANIHSVTMNHGQSQYFPEPNSNILYDFTSSVGWNVVLADRRHQNPQNVMELSPSQNPEINLDWADNGRDVLVTGDTNLVLNLSTRSTKPISEGKKFKWGSWGPKGKYAVLVGDDNLAYFISSSDVQNDKIQLNELKIQTKAHLVGWLSDHEAVIIDSERPLKFDFDTGQRINYAEVKGISASSSVAVANGTVFFCDSEGLKSGKLVENIYQ